MKAEFPEIKRTANFRTGHMIRLLGFFHILQQSFEELLSQFHDLFDSRNRKKNRGNDFVNYVEEHTKLEDQVSTLVNYFDTLNGLDLIQVEFG